MSDETAEDTYWRDITEAADTRNGHTPGRITVPPGEALPVQVTATMWVEAKGHCPDVAIAGLRRQVEHWRDAEDWELADGAVSIDHWPEDVDYQASVRLIRSVKW